jgi:hypothetical protein
VRQVCIGNGESLEATIKAIPVLKACESPCEHSEDLASVIEDFSVALNWPESGDAQARA